MNVSQLEAFVVLAEELHFGRAARRLSVSTPNLSKRIADLERELGVRLFERTSRQVGLTPAGALVLGAARRAHNELQLLQATASNAAQGRAGVVHISYSPGTGQAVAKLVRRLRASSEINVDVSLDQVVSVQVVEAVRTGRATIGICRDPPSPGLGRLVVSRSPRNFVAMPADHHLASRPQLTMEDLEDETFIHSDSSVGSLAAATEVLVQSGVRLDIRFERVQTETEVMDLVAAGFGLSLLSQSFYERNRRPDVVARPVAGLPEEPVEEHDLIWRTDDDSPLLRFVLEHARDLAR